MTRLIFYTAATLNGFLADEDNSLSWLFTVDQGDGEEGGWPQEFMKGIGVLVEGSTTYEWVLREEKLLAEPQKWQEFYGDKPTVVFTSRDLPVPDGADVRLINSSVADALPAIRQAAGDKDVWIVGGGDLVGQFFDAGALDELVVAVAPVTLTGGAPLLPRRIESDRLTLTSAEQKGQFAWLRYEVTGGASPEH